MLEISNGETPVRSTGDTKETSGKKALREAREWGRLQQPFDMSSDFPQKQTFKNDVYFGAYKHTTE